ncbi:MATE family efflux transporter [uncultured Methylophaga sp.]|uniref:MATE family efflux transporter n=1 Tax=uncultured Methylophaga sp. TaxID=285271 RepID=UPI002613049E|nr:MATE family efflux transporter [uncultured Methylophaga sp.]
MSEQTLDNPILTGPVISTFLRFALPSILGLLAITTASIVDGMFVGHFVSSDGLAAINLLLPYLTLIFGLALMIAIGGAVRCGHFLGQGMKEAASAVLSKCLVAVLVVGLFFMLLAWWLDQQILGLLGTPDSLVPLIMPYFHILSAVLVVQIFTMVLYYFVRQDHGQRLATTALVTGALLNILLDAWFIIVLDWGLVGAAWATAIAQGLQLVILMSFFARSQRQLHWSWPRQWAEFKHISVNGLSECINEISGGVVILVLNWLLVTQMDVDGIAAFAVINYLIFVSLMLYYGIADALHLLVSHNHGAGNAQRILQFVFTGIAMVLLISLGLTLMLLFSPQWLTSLFLDETSAATRDLSSQFIGLVWPLFLINGVNVILSIYLTAMQKPKPSMLIAMSRGLVLPVGLLFLLSSMLASPLFLIAMPLTEWLTFILATSLFWHFRPSRIIVARDADA